MLLPDELYRRAKERARTEGRTVTSVMEEALRRLLAEDRMVAAPVFRMPVGGEGGLMPGVTLTSNAELESLLDEGVAVEKLR